MGGDGIGSEGCEWVPLTKEVGGGGGGLERDGWRPRGRGIWLRGIVSHK